MTAFPAAATDMTDPAAIIDNTPTARAFREAIGRGALWSVGAHAFATVPGIHQLGALMFQARILPMTSEGRGETATIMTVLVSLTAADVIDVEVRHDDGTVHARVAGIYIDQLAQLILALDYDGDEILNPRYW